MINYFLKSPKNSEKPYSPIRVEQTLNSKPKIFLGRTGPDSNIYEVSGFGPRRAGPAQIDTPNYHL